MADQPSRFLHSLNPSEGPMLNLQSPDSFAASSMSMARQPKAAKPAPSSSHHGFGADEDEMNAELWHACAGPQHGLPPRGSVVAYFPQGHIEQVASFNNPDVEGYNPRFVLPAAVTCTLNDIQLSADLDTDEVFATCTLVPVSNPVDESARRRNSNVDTKPKSVCFTKILTVSDTSTHGGFSVPRRGAEDCFPPLDKTQDNPIQDLIAKDLHGNEWKFRHLFRGQPKRHLLTTGWSVFVSQKRLVAGDAVLFLRDVTGQLRIAVRLAPRQHKQPAIMVTSSMAIGVLEAAGHAVKEMNRFSLIYNPRSSPSQFIIPYAKYAEAEKRNFAVGQRVKSEYGVLDVKSSAAMKPNPAAGHRSRARFEAEDSMDSRCTGTIVEISDYDVKWRRSLWRSIKVNWDEPSPEMQERVSPWEIVPFTQATNVPPPDRSRKRYNKPVAQIPVAQSNSAVSRNSGVNFGRQDAAPPFGNLPRAGLQDFLDMRGMEGIHQPENGGLGMQVFHPYRNHCDVGSLPLSPRLSGVTTTHYVKDEDDTDLCLRPPVSGGVREQPNWPAASLRLYQEPRSSPSVNGPDCTVLSMGSNPASDCLSFISPPTPKLPMLENQSRRTVHTAASAPAASSDQHKCRLFGVSLAQPATPKVTTADLSSYSVSNDASEDSNAEMGTPLSALNLAPGLEAPWQRHNDADWRLKLAPVHGESGRNAESSTFRRYGDVVYDYKGLRFDR